MNRNIDYVRMPPREGAGIKEKQQEKRPEPPRSDAPRSRDANRALHGSLKEFAELMEAL